MTQHSSESLMERARLTDEGVLLAQVAQPDSKDTPFADVIAFLGGDIDDTETLLKVGHAIAHAQRVKMAQAVVAWLREQAQQNPLTYADDNQVRRNALKWHADALQAQLEAEAQK